MSHRDAGRLPSCLIDVTADELFVASPGRYWQMLPMTTLVRAVNLSNTYHLGSQSACVPTLVWSDLPVVAEVPISWCDLAIGREPTSFASAHGRRMGSHVAARAAISDSRHPGAGMPHRLGCRR